MVAVLLEQLQLLEGQDMALVSPEELKRGSIWSLQLATDRTLAGGRLELMQQVFIGQA